MKKIVALGAVAALVGGLFAAEPASNPSLVSFTGNASVEWGVDLDAGKTGFKNGTWTETKIKLFDAGDKATSGDGVWAELVMKIDDQDSCGFNGWQDGKWKSGNNAYIDVAKFHFNNFYVGIKSGDTQVGVLDFNTAVRSGDPWYHPGRWLKDVGPADYSQGIVAGYEDGNFNIGVDFRSLKKDATQYTDSYAIAAEAKLKDSNEFVEGLSVGAGVAYDLSDEYYVPGSAAKAATYKFDAATGAKAVDAAAVAAVGNQVGEVTKVENLPGAHKHTLGYSASVGYKFKIDDKYYVKPQAGLTGTLSMSSGTQKIEIDDPVTGGKISGTKTGTANVSNMTVAAALLFGWGDTQSYGNTGTLYYFDDDWGDKAKGLTPGVAALAYIPLPTVSTEKGEIEIAGQKESGSSKDTVHNALKALVVPSFYSGDLIENFKFAAYSEIGLFNGKIDSKDNGDNKDSVTESWDSAADPDNTTAMAFVAGLRYDIKADDLTITPKASIRYANATYMDNKAAIDAVVPASDKTIFPAGDFGAQKKKTEAGKTTFYDGDFFNLEAGVEVGGLINNSTFYAHYKSANLLNGIEYKDPVSGEACKMYNVKLGTFNVGAKISF